MEKIVEAAIWVFKRVSLVLLIIATASMKGLAQHPDLGDNTNSAKSWYGPGWLYALLIVLIVVLIGVFGRRRGRRNLNGKDEHFRGLK